MMGKSSRLLILPLLIMLGLCGCVSGVASLGPGGATPGLIYSGVTYPNMINPGMEYRINFDRSDIELLGPVEATASSVNILYFFAYGDSGYAPLMDQARAKNADGVMNLTVDTRYKNIFFFFTRVTTKLTGQAYRYTRPRS
jgi:hypothetical protein